MFLWEGVTGYGVNSFHIKPGCNDGTEIKAYMNEKDKRIWLMVFKNGWERNFLKKEYKHTRFLDEYFTDEQEMIIRIKEQVELHQGYDINYSGNFEE